MADTDPMETSVECGETVYLGSAEQFLTSGLLRREQIPGQPTCPKSSVFRFERDGRQFTVSRGRTTGSIKFRCGMTEEEQQDYWSRLDAERQYEAVQREESRNIRCLPKDRDQYVRICVRAFSGAYVGSRCRDELLKLNGATRFEKRR